MFEKQNINFIEILFTEYKWVNPKFQKLWEDYFINNREEPEYIRKSVSTQTETDTTTDTEATA